VECAIGLTVGGALQVTIVTVTVTALPPRTWHSWEACTYKPSQNSVGQPSLSSAQQ